MKGLLQKIFKIKADGQKTKTPASPCREVKFTSLLSGGFSVAILLNPPDEKLVYPTFVWQPWSTHMTSRKDLNVLGCKIGGCLLSQVQFICGAQEERPLRWSSNCPAADVHAQWGQTIQPKTFENCQTNCQTGIKIPDFIKKTLQYALEFSI